MPPQQTNSTGMGMNQPPQQSQQQAGSMGSVMPKPPKSSNPVGPLVGVIIIVLLMILGGLYLWGSKIQTLRMNSGPSAEEISNTPDSSTEALKSQGDSDDVPSIEADLNATDLGNLDQETGSIEAQLNAQ